MRGRHAKQRPGARSAMLTRANSGAALERTDRRTVTPLTLPEMSGDVRSLLVGAALLVYLAIVRRRRRKSLSRPACASPSSP